MTGYDTLAKVAVGASMVAWGAERIDRVANGALGWFGGSTLLDGQVGPNIGSYWNQTGNIWNPVNGSAGYFLIEEDLVQVTLGVVLLAIAGKTSHPWAYRGWAIFILLETLFRFLTGLWAFGLAGD